MYHLTILMTNENYVLHLHILVLAMYLSLDLTTTCDSYTGH